LFDPYKMSAALSNLAALLDQLQARVTELEGKAGIATPAAPPTATKAAAGAIDDEAAQQTRDWDLLVAKYGEEIAKLGAEIGGDVTVLVRSTLVRSLHAAAGHTRVPRKRIVVKSEAMPCRVKHTWRSSKLFGSISTWQRNAKSQMQR
jgi:hypothetical protein